MMIIIWCVYCLSSLNFSKYFLSSLNFYILDKGYHQAKGFRKLIVNWNCNAGHIYLDLFYFCPSFPVIFWERFCWIRKCKLICKVMIEPRDQNPRNWTLVDQKTTRATNHPPIPTKKSLKLSRWKCEKKIVKSFFLDVVLWWCFTLHIFLWISKLWGLQNQITSLTDIMENYYWCSSERWKLENQY